MHARALLGAVVVAIAVSFSPASPAQSVVSENFTGATTNNDWYFFNGACLTASSAAVSTNPGTIPGCTAIKSTYYNNEVLVGGANGVSSTSTETLPDTSGNGALRFTNGYPGGYHQNGAIVSNVPFPTGQGVQITFKTVTYRGDHGGAGGDGADGISFYLMDGSQPAGIGAWGGSLGYSCSNNNAPYNGLIGGYIGLGVDEYGNFLNGSSLVSGYTGSNSATGDNSAWGYGYKPGRIGLRGAGSISWQALTNAYGTNPGNASLPYYPATLATACTTGTFNSGTGSCAVCSVGTYNSNTNSCAVCPSNGNGYNSNTATCSVCPANTTLYTGTGTNAGMCYAPCANNFSFSTSAGSCTKSGNPNKGTIGTTTWSVQIAQPPTPQLPTYSSITDMRPQVVQKACSSGTLYNYSSPASPTSAGAMSLSNTANTAGILDYDPIPNAYKELSSSSVTIAKEYSSGGYKRGDATPIVYSLKITQDGLLSFAYSVNGAAWQSVIAKQSITASNGALPQTFRFGFAGSTGGSTNIHEILCFKAQPLDLSSSSTSVNEKQSAKIETGTQAYFAFYDPNTWTGRLTANTLSVDSSGVLQIASAANWDAACVLTGVATGKTCPTTGIAGATAAEAPTSRTVLTWNGTTGIPFEWANLSSSQQSALDSGDSTATADRLSYLRGNRTKEINAAGAGLYRARDSVLGDIVDSSPTWVGPPGSPYAATWKDRLYPTATTPENSGTQSYLQFVASAQTRANVVYVGANDGLLHGFRTGAFDSSGVFSTTTPNDGNEVLAYMPGAAITGAAVSSGGSNASVVNTIHGTDPTNSNAVTASIDYPNTQYGHNFFVDATPGTGDLHYGGAWHTWLVGGMGPGGKAIYALDVTNPANFSESNAASLVIGEWTAASLSCTNVSNCGNNLGNSYGTPQIRRLHNGKWAVIFGNGLGSSSGDAGIYVMVVDATSGAQTFYYLSTGSSGNNGIAYVTPADLDGDHVTDYVYAGDLLGNVWRFDLTSNTPSSWAVSTGPLFTAASGQPITTRLIVASGPTAAGAQQLMIAFGTGQKTQFTNTNPVSYGSGTQDLYGIWDWNLSAWNSFSSAQYVSLTTANSGLSSPFTLTQANLQKQTTFTIAANGDRDLATNVVICWKGTSSCGSGNTKFGWYVDLPGSAEQIVFNPQLLGSAFVVNSTVPANNSILSCTTNTDTGFTYAISVMTGGAFTNFFPLYNDTIAAGVQTDATGTSFPVTTANGTTWLVYQTVKDDHKVLPVNLPSNTKTSRLTWIELR
ncbi:MAG: putative type-4 fimbrial biosis protein precursor [Gammaproteobacteria bacterium]|nr:putative type-4 fimbrial biosis protein precursor [Gammaproteobacteria bacterium]